MPPPLNVARYSAPSPQDKAGKRKPCENPLSPQRGEGGARRSPLGRRRVRGENGRKCSLRQRLMRPLRSIRPLRLHAPRRLFSVRVPMAGLVAQLVEQCPFKALVQGSSPCQPTTVKANKSQ